MKLWIVGKMHPRWAETGWSLVGLFDNEQQARVEAAKGDTLEGGSAEYFCRSLRQIEVGKTYDIDADSDGWIEGSDPL